MQRPPRGGHAGVCELLLNDAVRLGADAVGLVGPMPSGPGTIPDEAIAEIARAHDLSQSNLMKVVQQLVEGGFVRSTRGRSGGVQLAKPAEEIHAGAVARFMEGETPLVDCASCILNGSCGLVRALAEAKAAFYKALDKYSLADAIGAPVDQVVEEIEEVPEFTAALTCEEGAEPRVLLCR